MRTAQLSATLARVPRSDALPENIVYVDKGCDLFPSLPASPAVDELAAAFDLGRRSVYRILRGQHFEQTP